MGPTCASTAVRRPLPLTRHKRQGNFDADAKQFCEALLPHIPHGDQVSLPSSSACTSIAPSIPRPWTSSPWNHHSRFRRQDPAHEPARRPGTVAARRSSVRNRSSSSPIARTTPVQKGDTRKLKMVANGQPRPARSIVKVKRPSGAQRLRMIIRPRNPTARSEGSDEGVDRRVPERRRGAQPAIATSAEAVRAHARRSGAHVASRVRQTSRKLAELDIGTRRARICAHLREDGLRGRASS